MLELTAENYHSLEANREYYSQSQLRTYVECVVRWWYQYVVGSYIFKPTTPMLIGSYIERVLLKFPENDSLEKFLSDNEREIWGKDGRFYKTTDKKGGKYKAGDEKAMSEPFKRADDMVVAMANNDTMLHFLGLCPEIGVPLPGVHHQLIVTGQIGGFPMKGALDVFHEVFEIDRFSGPAVVDLKTTGEFKSRWDEDERKHKSWMQWHWLQMALYQKLTEQSLKLEIEPRMYIAAETRQTPPDMALVQLADRSQLNAELRWAYETMTVMEQRKKAGAPMAKEGCNHCLCCRRMRTLTGPHIIHDWANDTLNYGKYSLPSG